MSCHENGEGETDRQEGDHPAAAALGPQIPIREPQKNDGMFT